MSKFSVAMKRFGGFMKRNAFYFLIVLCIASVATVIALAVTRNNGLPDGGATVSPNPDTPVINPDGDVKNPDVEPEPVDEKLKFFMPCNDGTVSKNFSDTALVWNPTLKQYSAHLALDFTSEDQNVFCSADGFVKEVGYNTLDGNYVEITHKDGYVTRYLSLLEPCTLKKGASVKQGQLLGKMSSSQGSESADGAHLHFEVLKDNVLVNPADLLISSEK